MPGVIRAVPPPRQGGGRRQPQNHGFRGCAAPPVATDRCPFRGKRAPGHVVNHDCESTRIVLDASLAPAAMVQALDNLECIVNEAGQGAEPAGDGADAKPELREPSGVPDER